MLNGPVETVVVLGLGYIGLPTAAALASRGVPVVGVDIDAHIVAAVNRGEVPFVEPDLSVAVSGAVNVGNLTGQLEVPKADAFIIAVPTPIKEGFEADLSYIRAATESIAPVLRGGEVIILESTSPPGTTRQVSQWLAELRPDLRLPHDDRHTPNISVAHCPERVLPGRIMIEIFTNERVIGGLTPKCAERAAELYRTFFQGDIAITDAESAEMAKLAENTYRDVNIAFANELSLIAERLQLDVWEIIEMANRHPRVNILRPGPGVGGHCIAVDPWFLISAAPDQSKLIRSAREINDRKPKHVVDQVVTRAERIVDPVIAALGLAFKADVDDLRESPAAQIVCDLAKRLPHAPILAVEPNVTELPPSLDAFDTVQLTACSDAIARADIVLILVDHTPFRAIKRVALEGKSVYDTRGLFR